MDLILRQFRRRLMAAWVAKSPRHERIALGWALSDLLAAFPDRPFEQHLFAIDRTADEATKEAQK